MSQENVEVLRRGYEALDRGDADAWLEAFHPDVEAQVLRGREGVGRIFALLRDTWADWRIEPERFLDAGDRVVVFVRMRAKGAGSGAEIEFERAQVWSFREGRATSMRVYKDRAEALEAVGLRE